MSLLRLSSRILKGKQQFQWDEFKKFQVVSLFFAAGSTTTRFEFISKLKDVYQEINSMTENALEIIFVSCDPDVKQFEEFYGMMPWAALPFEEKDLRDQLLEHYPSKEFPELVILKKNGGIGTKNGRADIEKYGAKAFYKWVSLAD